MDRHQLICAGKLLVQYKLLKYGNATSLVYDNSDIHLEVVSKNKTVTFNVKTTESPKSGGGKGKDAISWALGKTLADFIA